MPIIRCPKHPGRTIWAYFDAVTQNRTCCSVTTVQPRPLPDKGFTPPMCTAPELDAGSVSCSLAGCVSCGKIAVRVCPSAVPDHDPGLRLAGPAGPQPGIHGRGDHGAPSRGHDAPAPGPPGPSRTGPTA